MKAAIVYESLYGNTRAIADAIAQGLEGVAEPHVMSVEEAGQTQPTATDLLVVGGPTHIHGMSRKPMWELAVKDALEHPEKGLVPDAASGGPGLRAWFDFLDKATGKAAAFDTRLKGNKLVTGHASKGIAKRLKQHGLELIVEPASFLVDDANQLLPGELDRAREWGKTLGAALSPAP
ncbi:flavodoxin family protein [Pseudarthrobacter raffinosi]|uniref:flavodoxin family protein n=1 Tax=Pseudarthrobacter raffinosi TaxID=2953651 RepID=UPI00208F7DE5|nr:MULTISPECIES: flavodoxin domain-containing protein [unclassified Pseudarthrobacter]MCO4237081.1 flavodoxin domain-containing protein [Pseudarthrobacter sp. MDT3-28]MCO4262013.1 flavodoxin domain-containing protein [Pseudarthrobacter sp. MDT3-26]